MGTGQLIAGNIVNLLIAVLAFLQILPWQIAGYLIIGTVLLVTLGYLSTRNRAETGPAAALRNPRFLGEEESTRREYQRSERPHQQVAEMKEPHLKQSTTTTTEPASQIVQASQPEPSDTPTTISEGDYLSFEVKLEKGEEMVGEVSSDGQVNAYILDEDNLTALDSDQEFWYEAGSEGVKSAILHFTPPEDGDWFFVVENVDGKEVTAKTKVSVTKPSHPVPSLRAEGLELPDARLEGKL